MTETVLFGKEMKGGVKKAGRVVLDSVLSEGGIQWPYYCCVFASLQLLPRSIYSMSV